MANILCWKFQKPMIYIRTWTLDLHVYKNEGGEGEVSEVYMICLRFIKMSK